MDYVVAHLLQNSTRDEGGKQLEGNFQECDQVCTTSCSAEVLMMRWRKCMLNRSLVVEETMMGNGFAPSTYSLRHFTGQSYVA
jgi:hypothetical protein